MHRASCSFRWVCVSLVASLLVLSACADSTPQDPSGAPGGIPIFDHLGTLHHPITTASPLAQQYFDQGLRLVFAFNHEEAITSFEEAARLDPKAAMAYWGIALALGPNINAPMDPQQEKRAYEAVKKARELSSHVSEPEQVYINALAVRYSIAFDAKRRPLDAVYADVMREVWRRYPDDPDAGTLFAEAMMVRQPWDFWTPDGLPKGQAEEIVETLERVLTIAPDHPGACHYYIHTVEASSRPERALPCAERLPKLMPGAGHLVHMPAHLYLRLGRYREAAERNVHAAAVDHDYLEHRKLTGIYPHGYYPHNVHFLWTALTMEGRSREAIQAARDLLTLASWEEARKEPAMEEFTPTLLFALVRFGKWEEVLTMSPPPSELPYTTAIWHYARGVSFAATGRFNQAAQEHKKLAELARAMPQDRVIGTGRVADLARIAESVLAGEIAARQKRYELAIQALNQAMRLEDALRYYEPPLWHSPVRHSLGAVLLEAGRAAEAEQVYRKDLQQHPENGWALFGLAKSLRAQNKTEQAVAAEKRFQKAWAGADVTLRASRF
ncbi:MAG: tetratricopeptide repeat protein [Nitrospiraceae bacterium]